MQSTTNDDDAEDSDDEHNYQSLSPIPHLDDLQNIIRHCSPTLNQFGILTRVWQVLLDLKFTFEEIMTANLTHGFP